jgi:mevalonate kinase
MKGPLFYSKILLFGEYGIIRDSKGLSIPYNFYNGALKKDENPSDEAIKSNGNLKRFVTYLETLQSEHATFFRLVPSALVLSGIKV